jgi:hypothetical protein
MKSKNNPPPSSVAAALEAIDNLASRELDAIFHSGQIDAMFAYDEIGLAPINQKSGIFYRHFVPMRNKLISLLANSYRKYVKVALAHPREAGTHPDQWARNHLLSFVAPTMDWIREWYILACDGENQRVRHEGQIPFVPGQTVSMPILLTLPPIPPPEAWRAPAWLFQIAPTLGFIRPLKTKHAPAIDSEEKLGAAHSRLVLKLARRVFLWTLEAAIERVRNEEIAAAGAIPTQVMGGEKRRPNERKGWEQREKLYRAIREVLTHNPSLQGMKFCAELDKRHAPPLYDWMKIGQWREGLTWKEAWNDPDLRPKIRRVRQEAMKIR